MGSEVIFSKPIVNGSGQGKGTQCSVELLGLAIYGHMDHGYRLPCIDAGAQAATVAVNDRTSVAVKQTRRWRLLVARLGTCHNTGSARVGQRMALWSARSVEHLATDPAVKACNDVLERFIAGEATADELSKARADAAAADADAGADDAYAAYAAAAADDDAYAAHAAAAAVGAAYAAYAAAAAVGAAYAAYAAHARQEVMDDAYLDWLDRYLTAWQKVAADEGCLLPEDMEDEYVDFCEQLDFLTDDAGSR